MTVTVNGDKNVLTKSTNDDFFFQAANKLTAATGRRCLPLCIDVRQPETIGAAVDDTLKELGRIDILINSPW